MLWQSIIVLFNKHGQLFYSEPPSPPSKAIERAKPFKTYIYHHFNCSKYNTYKTKNL